MIENAQRCDLCGRWFLPRKNDLTSCTMLHPVGSCCHYGETEAPAPRDPAAGATPAREEADGETLEDAMMHLVNVSIAYAHNRISLDAIDRRKAAVLLAALRERDAAREDAARLETARTLYRAGLVYGIWLGHTHAPKGVPGEKIDEQVTAYFDARPAARAATAEGRTP